MFLLKESAKPVVARQKRRKIQIFALPPLRQNQQPEEQKQEEGADQDMQGEQSQLNPSMNSRR